MFDLRVCPACGRDSRVHQSNHFCEYTKERVVSWVDVDESVMKAHDDLLHKELLSSINQQFVYIAGIQYIKYVDILKILDKKFGGIQDDKKE